MMNKLLIICLYLIAGAGSLNAQGLVKQLKLLLLDERFEEVIGLSDSVETPDSLVDKIYYYRGRAYQSLLSYDSAYHYYSLAAALDSNSVSYRVAMGQMLAKLGSMRASGQIHWQKTSTWLNLPACIHYERIINGACRYINTFSQKTA